MYCTLHILTYNNHISIFPKGEKSPKKPPTPKKKNFANTIILISKLKEENNKFKNRNKT